MKTSNVKMTRRERFCKNLLSTFITIIIFAGMIYLRPHYIFVIVPILAFFMLLGTYFFISDKLAERDKVRRS